MYKPSDQTRKNQIFPFLPTHVALTSHQVFLFLVVSLFFFQPILVRKTTRKGFYYPFLCMLACCQIPKNWATHTLNDVGPTRVESFPNWVARNNAIRGDVQRNAAQPSAVGLCLAAHTLQSQRFRVVPGDYPCAFLSVLQIYFNLSKLSALFCFTSASVKS